MKIDNITTAKKREDRTTELTATDPLTGAETTRRYLAIRGGISWPTPKAPAYFCIVGQEYIRPALFGNDAFTDIGKRLLLAEHEDGSLSMEMFFGKLTDLAEQFACGEFYVVLPEERYSCGYLSDFNEFARKRNSRVNLLAAYDADSFQLGVSRIKSGINAGNLQIPDDSVIYAQLADITRQDLEESPENCFHAINGMRHVIGSYHRSAPALAPLINSRLKEKEGKLGHRRSWMTA